GEPSASGHLGKPELRNPRQGPKRVRCIVALRESGRARGGSTMSALSSRIRATLSTPRRRRIKRSGVPLARHPTLEERPAVASRQVVGGFGGSFVESFTMIVVFVMESVGGFTLLALCSPLSRTQPARPRRPPNCFDERTAPVSASTITFACVFLPFGMISIAYWVTPLSRFS